MIFAASIMVVRQKNLDVEISHSAFAVEADDEYSARGKALRVSERFYPTADGYSRHHAFVQSLDRFPPITDPETAVATRADGIVDNTDAALP